MSRIKSRKQGQNLSMVFTQQNNIEGSITFDGTSFIPSHPFSLTGDGTTQLSVTSGFSGTNMVSLAGTGSNAGILISGACGKAIEITGSATTGIGILTGTYTTGLSIAGTTATGIAVGATSTAGITIGATPIALSIGNVPTGISFTDAGATTEHLIDVVDAYKGFVIETGTYSEDTASKGIIVNATNSKPVSFLFDDGGVALATNANVTSVLGRTLFSIDQTSASARFASVRGEIKACSGIDFSGDTSEYYAVEGLFECAGATTIGAGAFAAGVCGMIWADGNFTGTGFAAGVMAKLYQTSGSTTTTSAFAATKWWNSADTWTYGLYIEDATVDAGNDIRLQGGAVIGSGSAAPTHSAVQGSLYLRTGQTQKACMYLNTDGGTTWTLLDTVTA